MKKFPGVVSLLAVLWGCGGTKSIVEPTEPSGSSSEGSSSTVGTSLAESTTNVGATTGDSCEVEPVPGECNPWCQDCSDDEKCVAVDSFGPEFPHPQLPWMAECVPIPDDADGVGESCFTTDARVDSCVKGSRCTGWDPLLMSTTCHPLCSGTPSDPICDEETTRCLLSDNNVLAVCREVCDPFAQDCPSATDQCILNSPDCDGQACWPMNRRDTFYCGLQSGSNVSGYAGGCTSQLDCDHGLGCLSGAAVVGCVETSCCTPYCDVNDDGFSCPDSEDGMICTLAFSPGTAPPGMEHVGMCRLP